MGSMGCEEVVHKFSCTKPLLFGVGEAGSLSYRSHKSACAVLKFHVLSQ